MSNENYETETIFRQSCGWCEEFPSSQIEHSMQSSFECQCKEMLKKYNIWRDENGEVAFEKKEEEDLGTYKIWVYNDDGEIVEQILAQTEDKINKYYKHIKQAFDKSFHIHVFRVYANGNRELLYKRRR